MDLYGEEETTEKKPRGSDGLISNGSDIEYALQTEEIAAKSEKLEWLIFLVGQEGELQVIPPHILD